MIQHFSFRTALIPCELFITLIEKITVVIHKWIANLPRKIVIKLSLVWIDHAGAFFRQRTFLLLSPFISIKWVDR